MGLVEAATVRKDVYIYNEATGWVLTSKGLNGKSPGELSREGKSWKQWIADGTFLPFELAQDDSFIVRVVIGELAEAEKDEWLHELTYKLAIPDGELAVVGGSEYLEEPEDSYHVENGFVQFVDVPAGTYEATIYTYAHSINGAFALEGKMKAGQWWRKTHPGEDMPFWVKGWCASDPDEDPGHENEWEDYDPDEDESSVSYIDFLVHLKPLAIDLELPKLDEGWFPAPRKPRLPAICPRGIVAIEVAGLDDREPYVQDDLIYTHDIAALVADLPFTRVVPTQIPIRKLVLTYWLAWLASDGVGVQAVLTIPPSKVYDPDWPELSDGFKVTDTETGYIVDFEGNNAKWTQFPRLRKFGEVLELAPAGTLLELSTGYDVDEDEDDASLAGRQRYRGLLVDGTWLLTDTYPELTAEQLAAGLALAEEIEGGQLVTAVDEDELEEILEGARNDFLLRDKMPVVDGLQLRTADETMLAFLGAVVFRIRFSDVWETEEADDLSEWDDMMQGIESALAAQTGVKVLEGKAAVFSTANTDVLDTDDLETIIREFGELGYEPIGALVCSKFSDVILFGLIGPDRLSYGVILRNTLGFGGTDFYSSFASGASLTTSTVHSEGDLPGKRIFRQTVVNVSLEEQQRSHNSRRSELARDLGNVEKLGVELEDFARAVDDFLVRLGG